MTGLVAFLNARLDEDEALTVQAMAPPAMPCSSRTCILKR